MNVLHIKYAVEVARLGSLNKAAETLFTAQPNISRSIKELESTLGITIFHRTAKGMVLTSDGEEFIGKAKKILEQIDEVEMLYKKNSLKKQKFSISVPGGCYISDAFAEFSKNLSANPAEIFYKETNSRQTIYDVVNDEYRLGVIRFALNYEKFFLAMAEEKGIVCEDIAEFNYSLIVNKTNPLANKSEIFLEDLKPYIEVACMDVYVPSISKTSKEEKIDNMDRRILVFERSSRLDVLSKNPETFTLCSPVPQKILDAYGLVQKRVRDDKKYKDVVIYRANYKLSDADNAFISALIDASKRVFDVK